MPAPAPTRTKPALTFDERMAALEGAIDRHHVYLERYLSGLTRNHADAEDILSRLWVHVLHKFKDDQIGNLPLLRRKSYQLFVDHYRAKMRDNARITSVETLPEPGIVRWTPKVGHRGSLTQTQENDPHVEETSSAQCPVQSAGRT